MNRNSLALILIILAVGIYFTFTNAQITSIRSIQVANNQYASAISNAEQLIKDRDKVLRQYNNISEDDKNKLEKMLPESVDNIRLVIDLNNVALRHGFNLKDIRARLTGSGDKNGGTTPNNTSSNGSSSKSKSSKSVIPNSTLDSITVTFSVSAPYLEFISFMQDLESNLRLMDISSLNVGSDDTGNYDFKVELKTYWLRQ
jgi:hypothetical protein